jgi:hypothetical protein
LKFLGDCFHTQAVLAVNSLQFGESFEESSWLNDIRIRNQFQAHLLRHIPSFSKQLEYEYTERLMLHIRCTAAHLFYCCQVRDKLIWEEMIRCVYQALTIWCSIQSSKKTRF